MQDLIILTAYGRGTYLLSQIHKLDLNPVVFDLSELLGPRSEQEVFGPFGLDPRHVYSLEQQAWFKDKYEVMEVPRGVTLWTEQGLLESRGPLVELQSVNLAKEHHHLHHYLDQLYSSVDQPPQQDREKKKPYVMTAALNLITKNKSHFNGKPVSKEDTFKVHSEGALHGVSFKGEEYKSYRLISYLSANELMVLANYGLAELLYTEVLAPRLCWQSAMVLVQAPIEYDKLPTHITFIPQMHAPWVESGLFVLQKEDGKFRLWFRNWYQDAHKQDAFDNIITSITAYLQSFTMQLQLLEPAKEVNSQQEPLFPIYDYIEWNLQKKWKENSVMYAGADKLNNLSLSGLIEHEQTLLSDLRQEMTNG